MLRYPFTWLILAIGLVLLSSCTDHPDVAAALCKPPVGDPHRVEPPDTGITQCFPSPDGLKMVVVRDGQVTLIRAGVSFVVGSMDYGEISWLPTSTGFGVQDSEGSGQSGKFSFVDATSATPELIDRIRVNAIRTFSKWAQCSGPNWYANSFADGWTPEGDINLVVQDGVHSEGCNAKGTMIGIVGNPRTGQVSRILTPDEVRTEWCTSDERKQFGYCLFEGASQ